MMQHDRSRSSLRLVLAVPAGLLCLVGAGCRGTSAAPSGSDAGAETTPLASSRVLTPATSDAGAKARSAVCAPHAAVAMTSATALKSGVAAARAHHYADALPLLCRAVEVGPADAQALGELGWVQWQLGDLGQAEQTTRAALAAATSGRKKGPLDYNLGKILLAQSRRQEALASFEASQTENPSSAAAKELLALGVQVAISAASGPEPIALDHALDRFARKQDFCGDKVHDVLSCTLASNDLVEEVKPPFRYVRELQSEVAVGETAQGKATVSNIVVETARGKFAFREELGRTVNGTRPTEHARWASRGP